MILTDNPNERIANVVFIGSFFAEDGLKYKVIAVIIAEKQTSNGVLETSKTKELKK